MTIPATMLSRLCELAQSDNRDDHHQRWELIATYTHGDVCPGCGAVLDHQTECDDAEIEAGVFWVFDVVDWFHTCGPGSPPMRAQGGRP